MRSISWRLLTLFVVSGLLVACFGGHRLTIIYDNAEGLKPGSRVIWQEATIGEVQSVAMNPEGRTAVSVQIKPDFSRQVTDQSRFLIKDDPQRSGRQAIEMIQMAEGGKPLANGAEVEGSTSFFLQLERGRRGLQEQAQIFQQELKHWKNELSRLPVEEWYKQLESQLEYWAKELDNASEETHRYFREEVLPRLEETLKELKKRLEKLGKRKEEEILDTKLKELKRI